jgi:hypothetical protein
MDSRPLFLNINLKSEHYGRIILRFSNIRRLRASIFPGMISKYTSLRFLAKVNINSRDQKVWIIIGGDYTKLRHGFNFNMNRFYVLINRYTLA